MVMREDSAVCMQHTVLVGSVMSSLMTLIGSLFGSLEWYYWITMIATLITTPTAVTASITLRRPFFIAFIILNFIELTLKVLCIVNYALIKHARRAECATFLRNYSDDNCEFWRLNDLNLTNAIVFHSLASFLNIILLIFAVQLLQFLGQTGLTRTRTNTNASGFSDYSLSQSLVYGTFRSRNNTVALNQQNFSVTL